MFMRNIQIMRQPQPVDVAFLDCENPDPEVLKFLFERLPKKADSQEFFTIPTGETFLPFEGAEALKLTTTHKLVLRKSKKHQDEWRLSVIESESFGEISAFSNVWRNAKTFRYKNGRIVTTTKQRLYKQLRPNYSKKLDELYRYSEGRVSASIALEQEILAKISYLKASKIYRDHSDYFLVYTHFESLLPGLSLRQYVVPGARKPLLIDELSMSERIQLSLALIQAVADVTSKGVIHADVKPANLMVECVDGEFKAWLVDMNLSKLASDETPNLVAIGSPLYLAPEALDGRVLDVKSDVFSLGIVIAQCFGATLTHFKSVNQIMGALSKPYEFKDLFVGVKDVTLEQRMMISALLKLMVEHKLDKRLSILEVTEAFTSIAQNRVPACLQKEGAPLAPPPGLQIPQTFFYQAPAANLTRLMEQPFAANPLKK